MKAEHRKELKTNELAERLGRLLEKLRSGSRTTSTVIWVAVALVLVGIVAWRYLRSEALARNAALWTQFDAAVELKDFEELADKNPGTPQARAAKFEMARILLPQGLAKLEAQEKDERDKAIQNIERARDLYAELAREPGDEPLLTQEALMGAATAEEALVGIPQADNPDEYRGSLDRALDFYWTLAERYPDSFQGKAARKRVEELSDPEKRRQIENFYVELNKQAAKSKS